MHTHSTEDQHPEENPCGHSCDELKIIVAAVGRLLQATENLMDAQSFLDPTTWSLGQAIAYCQAFVEYHPTMTTQTLIGGLGVHAGALEARVRFELGE